MNHVSQPDVVLFYLLDKGFFKNLVEFYLYACDTMSDLREYILASQFLIEANKM